ncbi:hypothetical protein [Wielerella bovis]|nr:hypothetical protein [Wielerella bovis]ULJ64139.1 hypothetical protein MIS33_08235 [Wielerella bovis]ULJ67946.1 hypothetical protein MIS31_05240 [Wielerella bovis]
MMIIDYNQREYDWDYTVLARVSGCLKNDFGTEYEIYPIVWFAFSKSQWWSLVTLNWDKQIGNKDICQYFADFIGYFIINRGCNEKSFWLWWKSGGLM